MESDDVFAVIAEGTRRQILEKLRDGDRAVGELVIELGVSQPTVSKHLKVLREAGLVTMRAQGQKRYYSLDCAPLDRVRGWLDRFVADVGTVGGTSHGGDSSGAVVGPGLSVLVPGARDAVPAGQGVGSVDAAGRTARLGAVESTPVAEATTADDAPGVEAPAEAEATTADAAAVELAAAVLAAAVLAVPDESSTEDTTRPIGRTMGRAAGRAADLLSQLRRRRDPSA